MSRVATSTHSSLTREQKEAIGLLSIGTFLEYFDLMLYVHMAVLLNELFFISTDTHTAALFSAFAFCSTYFLKPFGALIFGKIGDTIGRKATVICTTFLMSASCLVMANLPTYAEIGIMASWMITVCRMIQGVSSVGEITGSQIYLTEITKPPIQYPAVASVYFFATLGSVVALGIATITTKYSLNWRLAFWIGAIIALVGAYARAALRETPEFANAKKRLNNYLLASGRDVQVMKKLLDSQQSVSYKTSAAMFCISLTMPVFFYLTYIHYGHYLRYSIGYSAQEVIQHNFGVGIIFLLASFIQLYLCYKIHPLKILKIKFILFVIFILLFPILLNYINNPNYLFCFQAFMIVFTPDGPPAKPIFFKHFPVLKRFTYTCVLHAISHSCIYIVTAFGLVYCVKWFGQLGVLCIIVPVCCAYGISLYYFHNLEQEQCSPDTLQQNQAYVTS